MLRKDWVTFLVGRPNVKNIFFGELDIVVSLNLRKLLNFPNHFDKALTLNDLWLLYIV